MPENDLISRLRSGEGAAYRQILEEHHTDVLNCCFRFVGRRVVAEDLAQEVFMEVHRSIHTFRGDARLSTWIFRIAVTKSLDYLKHEKRKRRFSFAGGGLPGPEFGEPDPASRDESPDTLLETRERIRILSRALEQLPENQRAAFTLSKYEGLPHREIAEILGTTVPSIESLVARAKAGLRKKLERYYRSRL